MSGFRQRGQASTLKAAWKLKWQYHPGVAAGNRVWLHGNGRYPFQVGIANEGGTAEV
ncbi:MAG TPA: hypothetical protein PLC07_05985 [Bacillota bacterium]|nr:hypothetical protein [Bacillota bacterium]HPT86945.1 hypothetical protein [Bacillota bacterium]